MQLHPGEQFVITHQIGDHTDAGTYYVQAVVRNAKTDDIIDTVNLTDRGNRRFSKSWQVPQDVSGQGFYISITTAVYTDSGYTTKSENYTEEQSEHLIQARQNPNLGYGGGFSTPDIDYKKIKKMIDDAIAGIPEQKEVEIPEYEEVDLSPLKISLDTLQKSIDSISAYIKDLPRFEKTNVDFNPLLKNTENSLNKMQDFVVSFLDKKLEDLKQSNSDTLEATIADINGRLMNLDSSLRMQENTENEDDAEENQGKSMPIIKPKNMPDTEGTFRRMIIRKNKSKGL